MSDIADAGCSLHTLTLEFTWLEVHWCGFNIEKDPRVMPDEDFTTEISDDEEAQKAVASLNVKSMVEIVVMSYVEGYSQQFEHFVKQVAFMKHWAVTDEHQITTKPACLEGMTWRDEDETWEFTRTWTLKPATAATKAKVFVSQSLGKGEENLEAEA